MGIKDCNEDRVSGDGQPSGDGTNLILHYPKSVHYKPTKPWGLGRITSGTLHRNSGKKTDTGKRKGNKENEKNMAKYLQRGK